MGAGDSKLEDNVRTRESLMPEGVIFVEDVVTTFEPEENIVHTQSRTIMTYDYLVVTVSIQLDFGKIEGLEESMGKNGVFSNYSPETVGGIAKSKEAIFTQPSTLLKYAVAPQKIMYLADEYYRKNGVCDNIKWNLSLEWLDYSNSNVIILL